MNKQIRKEGLQIILKAYEKWEKPNTPYKKGNWGLCDFVYDRWSCGGTYNGDGALWDMWSKIWNEYSESRNKGRWYTAGGARTEEPQAYKHYWAWKPNNKQARINWLKRQIKKYE